MFDRRLILAGSAAFSLSGSLPALARVSAHPDVAYLFAYFKNKDNGAAGMRLAISSDGLHYEPLLAGAPVLSPMVGESKLMRDPCILKDPHRELYHLVWTTGWSGVTIGYACSDDLIHWSEQQALPVMRDFPGVRNCWAPEVIYDPKAKHFVLFWSSTVPGAYSEAAGVSEDNYNHRLYCATTTDFKTFTPSRLMFDPGFSIIDATFAKRGEKLYLIVKDERLKPEHKFLIWAEAKSPTGPFGPLSPAFSPSWVEGPTAATIRGMTVVFFDRYTVNHYGALSTKDFKSWTDISERIAMPDGASHGTIIQISHATYTNLQHRPTPAQSGNPSGA